MKKLSSLTLSILLISGLSHVQAAVAPKVIYGEDDRVLVENSDNELYKKLALSTAVQIKNTKLSASDDGKSFTVNPEKLKESFMNVCEDERYADVINAGNCSGFLVGEDLLVTAGHCMRSEFDCENAKWAFNYQASVVANNTELPSEDVYNCVEVINQELSTASKNDFALIRLDRKVAGREPLKFRTEGRAPIGTPLVVIGHPSGLPTIVADGAFIRTEDNDFFFKANLDTFGGNSGSAVFNADTGEIEGILVRGERDYVFDQAAGCNRVYQCENDGCRGEDVTRITNIPELVPGMTPVEPEAVPNDSPFPFLLM
ncbi:MAG: serine protease [Bacteriovoracaceae bacterium]|nr:serine protease [Bacteriovoracaceae bacterium]